MKLSHLLQNPLNRKIDRAKVAEIKRAIKTSGVVKPLVYTEVMTDKGKEKMLTDGHHRYVALKEMGYKDVPAVMADERGIDTAKDQVPGRVKKVHSPYILIKAKKPCREGYRRGSDGKCHRVSGPYYGGGIIVVRPPKDDDGETPPTNGTTNGMAKRKHTQPPGYQKETEQIRENRKSDTAQKPHTFKNAEWTHPNGHPRCILCGDEQPISGRCDGYESPRKSKDKFAKEASDFILGKHLQGEHDQSSHSPTGRAAVDRPTETGTAGARAGTLEGGAIHMATIAIPAVVVGALLRFAPMAGYGAIGVTTAFLLYEVPQLIFRMVEGGVRGYHGDRPYRLEQKDKDRKKFAKAEVKDSVGRTITRGDHILVKGKKGAYVGTYMGQDVVRIINRDKFVDLKTTEKNRIKISTEDEVLSTDLKDAVITTQVAEQLMRERKFLINNSKRLKQEKFVKGHKPSVPTGKAPVPSYKPRTPSGKAPHKVDKHGSHNQQDHDPTRGGKSGKVKSKVIPYKGPDDAKGKSIKLKNLVPAIADLKGNVYVGERGQIHIDVIEGIKEFDENKFDRGFVDTTQGIYLTRSQAGNLASESLREDNDKKVTKHVQHDQKTHGRRGGAKLSSKLKTFRGVKDHLSQGTKVILSAEKAGLSAGENKRRSDRLKRILQNNSKDVITQSWHEGENPIERSYIVTPNDAKSLKDIIRLSFDKNKLNQESIIVIRDGKAEAQYQDNRPSLHTTVKETREVSDAKGYYSQVGDIRYVFDFKGTTATSSANVSNPSAVKAAKSYLRRAGLKRLTSHEPVRVDKIRARRIANAYDDMKHDPNNPEVKAAYKAMADEVAAQYKSLPVRIQYTKGDPYSNSEDMRRDVRENKRLKIFTGGESHPLLGGKGQDGVTINDNFRAVHDYFGHAMRGYKFGPSGEENAWIEHSKMFSPLAQRAMTTETRGQNSWYNFSKENERRKPKDRQFAEQKTGILPDEFLPRSARRRRKKAIIKDENRHQPSPRGMNKTNKTDKERLDQLRDRVARLNLTRKGYTTADVIGLRLNREDLQEELTHEAPGKAKKMNAEYNSERPVKNPEAHQMEWGR